MDSLRSQYDLQALLERINLPRATYYDQRKRMKKFDKYAEVKIRIEEIFHKSHETYGYRRVRAILVRQGYSFCLETIRRLMTLLGLKVSVYSKHTSKYSSYRGPVGETAPNIVNQQFDATAPLTVFHTDVTQVKLLDGNWGYLSCVTDEASGEVITAKVSDSPNMHLIDDTLAEFKTRIRPDLEPILHSDQGWQYRQKAYRKALKEMNITQSMSRKGNCHDNAPIESFFNLLKRECLNRIRIENLDELTTAVTDYVYWFNNERISMNKNGLTPVEYRNQVIMV